MKRGQEMTRYLLLFSCVIAIASSAVAQTKASGSYVCGKADSTYVIQIPDQEGSSYQIQQGKCTWTKSFTVAGLESTQNTGVSFTETASTSARWSSTGVTYYKNGDKAYHKGTGTYDPKTMISTGTWTYIGGTGKLQGIKGGGTGTCKIKSADLGGEMTCEIAGEYTLPAVKK
jgi:hypothetical protein